MKFKHIRTGAILEPHSDFVLEQFQKSPDLIPFDDPEPVAAPGGGDKPLSKFTKDELPLELENVLAVMCVSYYKAAGLGTTAAAPGAVSSVKRGDVQTSFAVGSGSSGSAGTFNLGNDNGDFFGWKTVLNEYRKLRW